MGPAAPLLLFERVSKWYGPVLGVNQVTLELREGITGLVGSNGAGKSTLMRLATGQLRPTLGRVTVAGVLSKPVALDPSAPEASRTGEAACRLKVTAMPAWLLL